MTAITRTIVLPVAVLAASAVALAGCSSSASHAGHSRAAGGMPMSSGAAAASTASHNTADVTFATDMIPHHRQAVEMADLAVTRASNPTVTSLAAAIKQEQNPEITTMTGFLTSWRKPVPSASMGGMDMGGHSAHGMGTGMMTGAEMTQLTKSTGAPFDRLWVTLMIKHHQGAVAMARTELADGRSAAAKKLAAAIITGQTKEIATMTGLLASLPAAS